MQTIKIDGKAIAETILAKIKLDLEKSKTIPNLAIIQIGNDPASNSYIRQKQKAIISIGATMNHYRFENTCTKEKLLSKISELNNSSSISGIIIQRPIPLNLNQPDIVFSIANPKDVDGLNPNSPYQSPISQAVLKVLETIKNSRGGNRLSSAPLSSNNILLLGVGETGGKPIQQTFNKHEIKHQFADINTPQNKRLKLLKNADIVISCIGKPNLITGSIIKEGAICIGIGISRSKDNELVGDFDEQSLQNVASFYTPTPGGIGPLNVAFLISNLFKSSQV